MDDVCDIVKSNRNIMFGVLKYYFIKAYPRSVEETHYRLNRGTPWI
jgi:hypothetical protein